MTPAALCSFGGALAGQGIRADPVPPPGVGSWPCPCGTVAPVAGGRYLPHAEGGLTALQAENERLRAALESLSYQVIKEAEGYRFGTPCYDITLDHLYEEAVVARVALEPAADADSLGAALARFVQHGGTL